LTRYWWSERVGPGFVHGYEVDLLYEARSPYQHILILHSPFWGRVLVLDGVVQLTEKDEFIYHEMIVHVPFLGRKTPAKSVLIIGGADGGALRETLTHDSVERVVQVELDAAVLAACRKYMPEICTGWDDPRVELIIGDGAVFVEEAAAKGGTFDVIILDSTDPVGPAVALFERPFHRNLAACLSEEGVLVRQSGLPLTMPRVMPFLVARMAEVLPSVDVYRAPVPSYGDEMAFLAATKDGTHVEEPHWDLVGRFYDPACHRAAFALPVWWRDLIENYEDDGQVPVGSLY
jgi:spermidine synthase